ncbi:hypothetical protein FB107DRAFT_168858, partial [Schizophyllum commune]
EKGHSERPACGTALHLPRGSHRASARMHGPAQDTKPITSRIWNSRPVIHIMTAMRVASVTPPPHGAECSTHRADRMEGEIGLKRRYDSLDPSSGMNSFQHPTFSDKRRKRKSKHKRGWKGWVEGALEPSNKLIDLDNAVVLAGHRTRSGKEF